jgi:hypothetical protein
MAAREPNKKQSAQNKLRTEDTFEVFEPNGRDCPPSEVYWYFAVSGALLK